MKEKERNIDKLFVFHVKSGVGTELWSMFCSAVAEADPCPQKRQEKQRMGVRNQTSTRSSKYQTVDYIVQYSSNLG